MMNSSSLNWMISAAIIASCAMPIVARSEGAPAVADYTVTGNIGFTSDYVFNGISQSFRFPAVQGGFDYVQKNGVYLGTWASNISANQYTNADLEWDFYGGYNGKANDDLGYNLGLQYVYYPGGKTNPAGPTAKWDTAEFLVGGTWKGLGIKYTHTLTNWYGISSAAGGGFEPRMWLPGDTTAATGPSVADDPSANSNSRGSGYIEANYTLDLGDGLAVTAHAGHQKIRNFSKLSYTDYKLAACKTYWGFNVGLAYTRTNATDNTLYHVIANGDDKKLSGGIVALSVGRSF